MSINWNFDGQVIVQGIVKPQVFGKALAMKAYGTNIVAGVGISDELIELGEEIPIFDLVEDALSVVGEVTTSLIDVEPYDVLDAAKEAIACGIKNLIILTKNIPPLDIIKLIIHAENHQVSILGPSTPGLIIPEKISWGNFQTQHFRPGSTSIISYSEYLIYEVARELNLADFGQSMAIGLGQERIIASDIDQWIKILDQDINTQTIIWIEKLSNFETSVVKSFQKNTSKPIIVYLVGSKTLGKRTFKAATEILSHNLSHTMPAKNTYVKISNILKKAGIKIAKKPAEIPNLI
ncbi:succinyl-CoA synthetase, alpha subunit [Xenococcus sp. PCC 7305]|uniref:succinyl-CoA synthetase, alpha subunit n=1 Tax=Xenococcus sp. PCC 7305 TaxID=102125 RepID=UPI0002AD0B3D|nr:succinyl-CoA synthetase, alpha subunit [Xenococcus sp. PCC 7305]ELS04475.1 succinyl-CoA synthetase, alpha subunit [Xenococcus sp. PCC 7305]